MGTMLSSQQLLMVKVYLNVIHASLTLADMHRYHTQFSMVTSGMNMVSVVLIGVNH